MSEEKTISTFQSHLSRTGWISPLNQRRWQIFCANRRGYFALWIFLGLFVISLLAEFVANDRPILVYYKGEILSPVIIDYPESKFGGFFATTDYKDPFIQDEINQNGWALWPLVRFSYQTIDRNLSEPTPARPFWLQSKEETCIGFEHGIADKNCLFGNWHILGTDDQARDVFARALYGFRTSVIFGLLVTIVSSIFGMTAGAFQGYFGGILDLIFQRVIEVWNAIPLLLLILTVSAVFPPNIILLGLIMLLFSWVSLVPYVRAEFLRARNFEYVAAARALGVPNRKIIFRHLFPNAMVATLTYFPFILTSTITTLSILDFLGYGLPPNSASLGELLNQGKNNLNAPWLALTGFIVIALMLSLLIFIGEALRASFDPRKELK